MGDKKSKHILLEDDDFNRRGHQESKKDILKAIGRYNGGNAYQDDEKDGADYFDDDLFRISEEEDEKKEEF